MVTKASMYVISISLPFQPPQPTASFLPPPPAKK